MCEAKIPLGIDESQNFPRFKSIEMEDRKLIQNYIDKFEPLSCEYNFANLYCWQEPYNTSWSIYKNRIVIYDDVNCCSYLPLGKELTSKELVLFSIDMKRNGMGANVGVVPSKYLKKHPVNKQFYTIIDERDSAEYLYSVEALCDLKGAKLHKKKNLISQFHRKYTNSTIKPLSTNFKSEVKTLADEIYNSHERFLNGIENEHTALLKALEDFEEIGLEGLVVLVGNDLVAFSIFSPMTNDTYDIHFEKSCHQFKGAAQIINHETAKHLRGKCKFLNREQDLGIKGLRQAKMSYEPANLFDVHTLIFNQPG